LLHKTAAMIFNKIFIIYLFFVIEIKKNINWSIFKAPLGAKYFQPKADQP